MYFERLLETNPNPPEMNTERNYKCNYMQEFKKI